MALFTLGNLLSAVTQHTCYDCGVGTSLCHGLFGVALWSPKSLVRPDQRASLSPDVMGLTIANIGGVPLAHGSASIGWVRIRCIAGLGVSRSVDTACCAEARGRAAVEVGRDLGRGVRRAARACPDRVGSGAMFTVFTYIAPYSRVHGCVG